MQSCSKILVWLILLFVARLFTLSIYISLSLSLSSSASLGCYFTHKVNFSKQLNAIIYNLGNILIAPYLLTELYSLLFFQTHRDSNIRAMNHSMCYTLG